MLGYRLKFLIFTVLMVLLSEISVKSSEEEITLIGGFSPPLQYAHKPCFSEKAPDKNDDSDDGCHQKTLISNDTLFELVNRRLGSEIIINSIYLSFAGDGHLYDFYGSYGIKGGERPFKFFAPHKAYEEIQRLTASEKIEILLDAVFGLKPGEDGVPPPEKRDGRVSTLLKYKFDFVLGSKRDGKGKKYGYTRTRNHFSDHPNGQGSFPGVKKGWSLIVGKSSFKRQKVTDFFKSYEAETDYERLRVLLDILIIIKNVANC